jgi:hypothetical protein
MRGHGSKIKVTELRKHINHGVGALLGVWEANILSDFPAGEQQKVLEIHTSM